MKACSLVTKFKETPLVPLPSLKAWSRLYRDRESKTNFQLYRAYPDPNYLLNSSLSKDGREMKSHSFLSSELLGKKLKTWYSKLPTNKIQHCACSRL